jgi:hypothetical protein
MDSRSKTARIAGMLYFLIILLGIFSLRYVPSKLIVWDDPVATFNNISSSEMLFRLEIFAGIFAYIGFFLLPIVLYRLLHDVSKTYAVAMVALGCVSIPMSLANLLHKFDVLTLIGKASSMGVVMTPAQLQSEVMMHLAYYGNGNRLASVFWGLWLLPFGYLVYKSGFLPKALGILLMVGCFGYVFNFAGGFLSQTYRDMDIGRYVTLPASLGELGICLWMLIVGVRTKHSQPSPLIAKEML